MTTEKSPVPTMNDIREYWAWSDGDLGGTDSLDEKEAAKFDQALAAHDAEVRSAALEEAVKALREAEMSGFIGSVNASRAIDTIRALRSTGTEGSSE